MESISSSSSSYLSASPSISSSDSLSVDNLKDASSTANASTTVAMETISTSSSSSSSSLSSTSSSSLSEDRTFSIIRTESSTTASISYSAEILSSPVRSTSIPAAIATTASSSSSSSSVPTTPASAAASSSASSSSSSSSLPTSAPSLSNKSSSSSSTASNYKTALLRLMSDLKALENDTPEGVSASPLDSDNLFHWRACIFGPPDTAWEGGIFQLQLQFPKDYPQKAPTARFTSKIYHPNVFSDGTLCLDILQDHWSPVYTVSTILTSIQSLLTDPNPASPANPEAAKLYASDPKEYRKKVRACVAKCMSM